MKSYVNPLVREKLKSLHPGKEEKKLVEEYYRRKIKFSLLAAGAGLLLGMAVFIGGKGNGAFSGQGEILREAYDGNKLKIPAVAHSEQFGDMDVDIVVDQRMYTEEEREEAFDKTEKWLEQVMPGKNESLSCVRENLVLPDYYEECGIDICYRSSHYDLINENGRVGNEDLKEETVVLIKAELTYGDYSRSCTFEAKVYPPLLTEEEKFQRDLEQTLSDENQRQREEETFRLPDYVGNERVSFSEKGDKTYLYIVFMGFLAAALLYRGMDRDLDKLWEKRKQELLLSYPDFVGKLALLTGAGMNAMGAIKRIYHNERDGKNTPLYEELGIFVRGLDNGMLEERALENLGKRSGLPQYRKFCSLLSVNLKKGSINLKKLLEQEAEDAFAEHQNHMKKLGEEAGTKLLLPMILMLAVVLVIIMVPAFLTYQIS